MKNVINSIKAILMALVVAVMIGLGSGGTVQAYNLDNDPNYPDVVETEECRYYINISSAHVDGAMYSAEFITVNSRGTRHVITYQFCDGDSGSYWSTPASSSWHAINNRTMWMLHNSAKYHAYN